MRNDLKLKLELLLDMNKDNIITYPSEGVFKKSFCGECVEGKIFDPYKHTKEPCEFCQSVKEHNFKIANRNNDSTFGIRDSKVKIKIDKLNNGFKEGKFVGCSCILDISTGFNLDEYKTYIDGLNITSGVEIEYLDGKELYDKRDYKKYENTKNLILVLYSDINYEYLDVVKGLLERRSEHKYSTLVLSRHVVNNFFKQLITKEFRYDLLYVL